MAWRLLVLALLAATVLPIWLIPYFPSQDGPSHLHNARVLLDYADHANYLIRQCYRLRLTLIPNLLGQGILTGLMAALPPLVSEKILLSLIVVLLPLSTLYLAGAFDVRRGVFGLTGFVFAYHNLLFMGFYNFSLSLPLCLIALGLWVRRRRALRPAVLAGFYALALLTYVAHFASFAVLAIAVASIEAHSLLTCRWGGGRTSDEPAAGSGTRPARFAAPAFGEVSIRGLALLPLFVLGAQYALLTASPEADAFVGTDLLRKIFWKWANLVTFTDRHAFVVDGWWVLIATAVSATVYQRVKDRQAVCGRDGLLIACAAMVALFVRFPWQSNEGGWVSNRLHLFVMLLMAQWFGPFHRALRAAFATALVALALAQLLLFTHESRQLQAELREFAAASALVEAHSTVAPRVAHASFSDGLGGVAVNVSPFANAACYNALGRDVVYLDNYEAKFSYFPVNWGSAAIGQPDYVVAWRPAPDDASLANYVTLHRTPRLQLLRRAPEAPDISLWETLADGRRRLRLSMAPSDGSGTPACWPVGPEQVYVPGKFGWLGGARLRSLVKDKADSPLYRGCTLGERDGVLRVCLPNGLYRLTYHFMGIPNGRYQVNVRANDASILAGLVVTPACASNSAAGRVEVKNGRLDQVFYTTWRKSNDLSRQGSWALGGVEIEQDR